MKITFIGAGNMGGAIARGFVRSGISAGDISIIDHNMAVRESFSRLGCKVGDHFEGADFVILAVKPWQVFELGEVARMGRVLVSIAAGVTVEDLEDSFGTRNIVRVMPNTAVENLCGVSFVAGNENYVDNVAELFGRLGESFVVDEDKFDACMALGSCGLAYALRYARASMSGAVEMGLRPDMAQKIVAGVMRGVASLLESGNHPEAEIDKITTPGGITIKGLNTMEQAGFTNAVIQGLLGIKN